MDNYIQINGRYYAFDLDKFMESCKCEHNVVNTITQTYGQNENGDMTLISKEVGESKDNVNEIMSSYRYNMLTTLINLLVTPVSDGNGNILVIEDTQNMYFGQKLAFNTMLELGIIYEIETEE